ncbi:xanthine dehydrogenase family protein molybdopterin-binding subunit [Engelhardtia mirabilis]
MAHIDHGRMVGTSPARTDGAQKVRGLCRYVDDLEFDGLWHGATVRSPHACARIVAIDAAAALADPDVVVLTARDLPGPNVLRLIADDWPVLADGRVNHFAEPVALVAAPTRERARAAVGRVEVRYEVERGIHDLDQALASPRILASCRIERGDLEAGFAAATHVVEGVYDTAHQEHVYIEPQGMVARPTAQGELEVIGSLQCPYYVQKALALLFDEPVRVRQAPTGGGFGGKEEFPDAIAAHAALLARRVGRPVKIVYDRHEDMQATPKRHPSRVRHRTGVDAAGKLCAMEIEVILDGGAYTTLSGVVLSRAVLHAGGAYACPNVRIEGRALATNTVPSGAFRGFGAPQTQFAVERQMDRIARLIGTDPLTLRERNAYRLGDVTPTGQVLEESVSALECLAAAQARTDFKRRWHEIEDARASGEGHALHGIGLALSWHGAGFTGEGEQRMRSPVRLALVAPDCVEVRVAACDFGQGTTIVLSQIVADALGLPTEMVRVVDPDTSKVPDSGPTVASRTVMVVGGILERAGRRLVRELGQGGAPPASPAEFVELARAYLTQHGELEVEERFEPAPGQTFDETTYTGTAYSAYGWGVHVAEVRVDADTLATRVERATLVFDVGKAIHPVLCAGQVEGGSLQAFGFGHLEDLRLSEGRPLQDSLSTYVIPTAVDAPDFDTILIENPTRSGPQGAKGVGELPMDGGGPALVAAIENATGIVATRAPATPEVLLEDLLAGRTLGPEAVAGALQAGEPLEGLR